MSVRDHPSFKAPNDPFGKIWRYQTLAKFLSMLDKGALFFSRASKFDDPFENSLTRPMLNAAEHLIEARRGNFANFPYSNASDDEIRKVYQDQIDYTRRDAEKVFVSCWHLNDYESAAMWSIYSKSGESIAIQSNFTLLKKELPLDFFVGEVQYIDYARDTFSFTNTFDPIMHKRKSFTFEQEVRAVVHEFELPAPAPSNKELGFSVPVDLNRFIEAVYVHPEAADWFFSLVKNIAQKYRLNASVNRSTLSEKPVW